MAFNRAQKRYNRTVAFLMAGYVFVLFGVVGYANNHFPLSGAGGFAIAVLPALPVIGVFFAIGRYLVEESDEYLRARFVRQALIATGVTLGVATVWGFLENFGVVRHVYAFYIAMLWFGALGLAGLGSCVLRLSGRADA